MTRSKQLMAGLLMSIFSALPTFSHADNARFYAGLSGGSVTLTGLGLGDMTGEIVSLRGGYQVNKYFGAELEYGQATGSLVRSFISVRDLETANLFLVGRYPVSDQFSVHVRGGLQSTKYKLRNSAIAAPIDIVSRVDDTNPAIGIGATWHVTKHIDLRGDYTKSGEEIFSSDKRNVQATQISLQWRF